MKLVCQRLCCYVANVAEFARIKHGYCDNVPNELKTFVWLPTAPVALPCLQSAVAFTRPKTGMLNPARGFHTAASSFSSFSSLIAAASSPKPGEFSLRLLMVEVDCCSCCCACQAHTSSEHRFANLASLLLSQQVTPSRSASADASDTPQVDAERLKRHHGLLNLS